jgi:hypothetical protein
MSTALQIIEDAFDSLEIKSAEVDLETDEINNGIRRLNRMMTAWAQQGINLSYTKIENSSDIVTIPDWAEEAVVSHLAIRLAPSFGVTATPSLVAIASESFKYLRENTVDLGEVNFPTTLPVGAGNNYINDENFFTDSSESTIQTNDDSDLTDGESVDLSVE